MAHQSWLARPIVAFVLALYVVACERSASPPRPLPPPPPMVRRTPASPEPARAPRYSGPPSYGHAPMPDRGYAEDGRRLAARFNGAPAQARMSGAASYYGDSFAGRLTASGERYDPRAYTAAHRTLPFGSVVRVVREDTGQITYVRINDRGPFVRGRVLDLSRAAARSLDMIRRGVIRVRVELVERGPDRPRKQRPKRRRHGH